MTEAGEPTRKKADASSRRRFLMTAATLAISAAAPWKRNEEAAEKAPLLGGDKRSQSLPGARFVPARYKSSDGYSSEDYVVRARDLVNQRNYWDALPYLEKVQLSDFEPDLQSLVLVLFARALVGTGQVSLGQQKLSQAVATDPSDVDGYVGLSWADFLLGDLGAASQALELGKRAQPDAQSLRLIASLIARERLRGRLSLPFGQEWQLRGKGIVCCPCAIPCPCRSNGPPTCGHCENIDAIRIVSGYYGKVSLSNLTYCLSSNCGVPNSAPPIVYVDQGATDEQIVALEHIFQSFDVLNPFAFLHLNRVPIRFDYSPHDQLYAVEIPGRLHMRVRRRLDGAGNPALLTAATDYYSNTIEYATNLTYIMRDDLGGIRWDYSGHQANIRDIRLDSANYREGMMLIQFADGSGYFNDKQLELIRTLQLPMLSSYPRPSASTSMCGR